MNRQPCTVLPVSVAEAFAALEDRRFIALCAADVVHQPPKGDGVLRGHLTYVHGEAEMTYQLTVRVVEADADEHRVRYDVLARELRGGSLAALTLDAVLSVVDEQTTLALQPHLVLAGPHGGIQYTHLETVAAHAVGALGLRIAGLLGDQSVREWLTPTSAAENELAAPTPGAFAHAAWLRALATPRMKQAVLAMAIAGGLSTVAYVWVRRSRAQLTKYQRSSQL